ncbi:hypothetical protein Y032_0100g3298 [Ancylostoma ceylanicum]|uniref:Uncharacterized protein n=1 Tax=Ancylostoma ceylanicum TaxID=53326 RepID=A0A016TIE7_9BILA|nr:hypothetical protein Y032_0100g3298 [Ancylostoma ceylanicum]
MGFDRLLNSAGSGCCLPDRSPLLEDHLVSCHIFRSTRPIRCRTTAEEDRSISTRPVADLLSWSALLVLLKGCLRNESRQRYQCPASHHGWGQSESGVVS